MDFLAPQCGSASPSPRTVAPPSRVFHEAASCRRSCLVRDLVESHGLGRSQPSPPRRGGAFIGELAGRQMGTSFVRKPFGELRRT